MTEFEIAVLDMRLAGNLPALQVLRAQRDRIVVASREHTGVGFFTEFSHPADTERLHAPRNPRFGDVFASIGGLKHGAGFVLFIDDGLISVLEGFSYGNETWPETPAVWTLRYHPPERNLTPLASLPPNATVEPPRGAP